MTKAPFEITINNKSIKSLSDLESLNLSKENKELLALHLLDIANSLIDEQKIHKLPLRKQNQLLFAMIAKLHRQRAVDKIALDFHGRNMGAAAADWLLNPDPIEVHSTHAGRGLDFMVRVKQVLAVKSNERQKNIYLQEALHPKDGGPEHSVLYFNSQGTNLKAALWELQKNQHFLQQASRSVAINVFHYKLEAKKEFVLIAEAPKNLPNELKTVSIDKNFDAETYYKRLIEIGRLNNYKNDFAVNQKKLEEIRHYIKEHDITF